jgi:glucan biosynthesis protein C
MPPGDRSPERLAASDRLHGLEALRALAMLLVIVAHGVLSYVDVPYGSLWVVREDVANQSRVLSTLFWWLHGFRLPLYFVLAGFFADRLCAARGVGGFLRHRIKRILVPFAVGGLILLPLCYYVFAAGWWLAGECSWDEIRRVKFAPRLQAELFGPLHLWFLEYLFLYALIFAAAVTLGPVRRSRTPAGSVASGARLLDSPWRPLWCMLPTALIVSIEPGVVLTHHNSFVPTPSQFVHYAVYFAWGVWFHRLQPTMAGFVRWSGLYLIFSVPVFALAYALLRQHVGGDAGGWAQRLLLAASLASFAWLSIFGFLGIFQSAFSRPRPRLQYLADAAYWIYLIHLPIVVALQVVLARMPAPAIVRATLVVSVALAACLWSYERWVRYGAIGSVLSGPRVRRPASSRTASPVAASNPAWMASVE